MKLNINECANCGHDVHPGSTLCRDCIVACGGGKEKAMIKTAPRIAENTAEFLPKCFSSLNAGAEYILDSFPVIYQRTLQELKGVFGRGELMLMVDVLNATMLTARIAGQHMPLGVADACDLDHLDEKWEIEKNTTLKKLSELSIFQTSCLEIWANGFWYAKDPGQKADRDLEAYVKTLL